MLDNCFYVTIITITLIEIDIMISFASSQVACNIDDDDDAGTKKGSLNAQ